MKRSLSVSIMFCLILTFSSSLNKTNAQSTNDKPDTKNYFTDVEGRHPFSKSIGTLKERGIIQGYADKTFRPDFSISRAEFVALMIKALGKTASGENCFTDVKNEWFAPYICTAKNLNLVQGYSTGRFEPQRNINFAEGSTIIAKAFKLKSSKPKTDEPWYKPAIQKLEAASSIPVSIDYVEKKLSRGEMAEMMYRLIDKVKDEPTKTYDNLVANYPTITSCDELQQKITGFYYNQQRGRGIYYMKEMMGAPTMATPSANDGAADMAESVSESTGSADYSKTNVQVEGVDEADIIKNDGGFIYIVNSRSVRIIKAYKPEELSEIAQVEFSDKNFRPQELYVVKNKLITIGYSQRPYVKPEETDGNKSIWIMPSSSRTKVVILDMTDKKNLKEDRSVEFEGSEVSSRLIDSRLYLVTNYTPYSRSIQPLFEDKKLSNQELVPVYQDSELGDTDQPITRCEDIHFLPRYDEMNMTTIASFDVDSPDSEVKKDTIMGSGNTIYSSVHNLYVAGTRYDFPETEIFNIWMPPRANERTIIYRFNLDNGEVAYKGQGEVKGHLLNQFAMDENGDTFRLATTTGDVWDTKNKSKNHVFVLNIDNLSEVLGKIENIAPGEKIYSVRFMGNRAYMVTFKKVDPFFVIDLSDSKNPQILGELKIPGFSDYLHPYDDNHIIGFGKEAVDPKELEKEGLGRDFDFAWYQGMKIALFEVTDVANPKVLFKELIGDRGTDSPLLSNHKALLFDKKTGLLSFPVTVAQIKDKQEGSYTGSAYGQTVFQGAYVYKLDLENGFQLKGKVTHFDDAIVQKEDVPSYVSINWYDQASTIQRIVWIDQYLYTISLGKIKALNKETVQEVKAIKLEMDEDQYYPYEE